MNNQLLENMKFSRFFFETNLFSIEKFRYKTKFETIESQ